MAHTREDKSTSMWESVLSSVFYGFISISMTFSNKLIMQYNVSSTMVVFCQMVFAVVVIQYLVRLKFIRPIPPYSWDRVKVLVPIALCYNLNSAFGLSALKSLVIPMYSVLKRMSVVMVLFVEWVAFRKTPSSKVGATVVTIALGALVAGLSDLAFDFQGYMYALVSCVLQASYLVLVQKTAAETSLDTWVVLYYHSLLSLPFFFIILLFSDNTLSFISSGDLLDLNFLFYFLATIVQGVLLNYSMFLCTMKNSALTTTIVGNVKAVASTFLGFFVFGGDRTTFLNVFGVFINTVGALAYAVVKYHSNYTQGAKKDAHHHSHANGNGKV